MEPLNRPIDDPFFAEVRRRHPDVDIVLVPPAELEEDATVEELARIITRKPR